jgi:hypothetical protein
VPNNTLTAVPFGTLVRDDANYWSSSANTKLTAPSAGWYAVGACVFWPGTWTGASREINLRLNGVTTFPGNSCSVSPVRPIEQTCAVLCYCNAGDYFEMTAYQNQGFLQNITTAVFSMIRLP